MAKRPVQLEKPKLFSSAFSKKLLDDSGAVLNKTSQDFADSNIASTSSFRYDPVGVGVRSTQQLNVDFSKFETHTFFGSAEANVNVAFDRIINEYPFDGTRKEVEAFVDSLTGFEKWVLDRFPTNVGYLNFSGSASTLSTEGNFIIVNDYAGYLYPTISKKRTGETIIDPKLKSFSIELHLFVPSSTNRNEVICQKISGSSDGFTLAISQSNSSANCGIIFAVSSGSLMLSASAQIAKGEFNHIVAVLDRHPGVNQIQLYVNDALASESDSTAELGQIGFSSSPLVIGSGSTHDNMHSRASSIPFIPNATFSGSIDELRIFHATRNVKEQKLYGKKSIYASPELKLYFKFNEPTGSIGTDSLVIDSSGNSLHALVSNFGSTCRLTSSIDSPMLYEKRSLQPILFPAYEKLRSLNVELLASASDYDAVNPNVITKLVPPHYFQVGQEFEALETEEGFIGDPMNDSGPPGTLELGSSQLLSAFLYVWARQFDEIKMMIDQFGSVIHVDYDKYGFAPDQFLQFIAKYYGFEMPGFFVNSSIEQFLDAENVSDTLSTNELSLQYIQNQLWRRILTNIGEVIRSKGTLHSIKVLLRSMGIEPNSSFRLREYGGPTFRNLENARENRQDVTTFINFSGSLANVSSTLDSHGVSNVIPFLKSSFLSGSRIEPGYPLPVGTFIQDGSRMISNVSSDGLYTSGSWTAEAIYKFPTYLTGSHFASQSLMRMNVTGSITGLSQSGGVLTNLVAISGSGVKLFISPGYSSSLQHYAMLYLTGVDVMDGKAWNVCFGRRRADDAGSFVSSSYFIKASRQDYGNIVESYTTSSYINESGSILGARNAFEIITAEFNASGAYITVGSQSISDAVAFLNTRSVPDAARESRFSGQMSQLRFWSKALEDAEWFEHVRNFRSLGVQDPLTKFNFVSSVTGSFEKLRLDISMEQDVTMSNAAGDIMCFDFSQNTLHVTGSGFERSKSVFSPHRMYYSQLSSKFDEAASNEKVRVRSFKDFSNVSKYGGAIAPLYELPRSEEPNDDVRFSIDFSISSALDDDIVKMFSTFDELDNVLGNPELSYSPDYPDLERLRDVYFNRLVDKVKLRQFFEFFKWFDSILNVSTLIEQLVPRKTKFLGTNFVIESHMLERAKIEYQSTDMYLGENKRSDSKGVILLQQIVGNVKRF